MQEKIPIIVIVGPTASGKTALGVEMCLRFGGEVISADSMQIYEGMDIASAKPTAAEMCGVEHHLINCVKYGERFSVAEYCRTASQAVAAVYAKGKLPFLVGGTGLYVDSLIDNIEFTESAGDAEIRQKLYDEAHEKGNAVLLERLFSIDPETAERLHPNDGKRIIRALEFFEVEGIPISKQNELSRRNESPYKPLFIGISFENRELLYDRINRRVDKMLEDGLEREAREQLSMTSDTAAQAIGHKELLPYIEGREPLNEAIERLKRETRRYAKRQLTWFRRNERINWFYFDNYSDTDACYADVAATIEKFTEE